MRISNIPDLSGSSIVLSEITWDQFVATCHEPILYKAKHQQPLMSMSIFGDVRSAKGSLRHNGNVMALSGICVDYDGGVITPEQACGTFAGCMFVLFTTASHTPDAPRWRAIFPLGFELPVSRHRELVARVNGMFGSNTLAPESFAISHSFYIGAVEGVPYETYVGDGAYIDQVVGVTPIYNRLVAVSAPPSECHELTMDVELDINNALVYLSSDDRDTWVAVGQNLKPFGDVGFKIWERWSMYSSAYDPDDMEKRWEGFAGTVSDFRSIFKKASELGWVNPKIRGSVPPALSTGRVAPEPPTRYMPPSSPLDPLRFATTKRGSAKPLSSIENLQILIDEYGIDVWYDEILKEQHVNLPVVIKNDMSENGIDSVLRSICAVNEIPETIIDKMPAIFMKQIRNPIVTMILSKPWDGVTRVKDLCNAIGVRQELEKFRDDIMRMWLVQCVASADGAEHSPIAYRKFKYETVLVFRGRQGKLKTSFFQSLVPVELAKYIRDGVTIDTKNKDSIYNAVRGFIVELGELDATFRSSDIACLKGFLSNEHDSIRLPYDRKPSRFQRKTSYCATVNESRFLADKTGNRRFPVIDVKQGNMRHGVDMQQLWAEIWTYYIGGEQWWPTPDLEADIMKFQVPHERLDHVEDALQSKFDLSINIVTGIPCLGMAEILERCSLPNTSQHLSQLRVVLDRYGFEQGSSKGGKRGYRLKAHMIGAFTGDD